MTIATARSRSPLELPPRTPGHEPAAGPRLSESPLLLPPLGEMTRMPISFGVLLLALGVTCFLSFSLSGLMFHNVTVRSEQASRATERRLGRELMQLRASASALQGQLELRSHDVATQAEEIERISAQLETLRDVGRSEARGVRARRHEAR